MWTSLAVLAVATNSAVAELKRELPADLNNQVLVLCLLDRAHLPGGTELDRIDVAKPEAECGSEVV